MNKYILIIGFVAGLIGMYLYIQPNLTYEGKSAKEWASMPTPTPVLPKKFNVAGAINAGASYYEIIKYLEQSNIPVQIMNVPQSGDTQSNSKIRSYGQYFINNCGIGSIYCLCLYSVVSTIYTDSQIKSVWESGKAYSDPAFINGFNACNSRFSTNNK